MSGTIGIDDRIRMIMDMNHVAWWEMELPSGAVFFHENKARMFGGKAGDFVHYTHFTQKLSKKDFQKAMHSMKMLLSGESQEYVVTYRIKNSDGKVRILFDRGRIVGHEPDGTTKIMGIITDITDALNILKEK